jgi:hypothetical protein
LMTHSYKQDREWLVAVPPELPAISVYWEQGIVRACW